LQKLINAIQSENSTLLCVGPLSTNIIDVAINFSNQNEIPIVLVASRRQIEAKEFGSGYVNKWSTEDLIEYVKAHDGQHVYFERDHGGPWQSNYEVEKKANVEESMSIAKRSYEVDIDAGMHLIHIDPTIPVGGERLSYEVVLTRLFELYGHVSEYAKSKNRKIYIEVGTEEQSGSYTDLKQLEDFIERVVAFCKKNAFENPLFIVIQTGAKVMESRNVGLFERGTSYDKMHLIKNIMDSSAIAKKHGIFIKEHNADYLSFENLALRPSIGIKASNVAPELGFIESKAFLNLLNMYGSRYDVEKFVDVVHSSKKWEKWVIPESNLKKSEKTLLAAHYLYSHPEIIQIKENLQFQLQRRNIDLNEYLKKSITAAFYKYGSAFGLLK
jgi:hypothetical protein